MTSKLSWHIQLSHRLTQDSALHRAVLDSGVEWVKMIDPPVNDPWDGQVSILGRVFVGDEIETGLLAEGARGADRYFEMNAPFYNLRRYVALWEGVNEPYVGTPDHRKRLCEFTIRWAELMRREGYQTCGLSLSVGWPAEGTADELWPAIEACDAWSVHEYSAPNMAEGAGWYCLRYQRTVAELEAAGRDVRHLFITEAGIDGGVIGFPEKGWRYFLNDAWSYLGQLGWYDEEIQKDPYVQSAMLFTALPTDRWRTFSLDGIEGLLAEHIRASHQEQPLPEDETATDPAVLAEKCRWWNEEGRRCLESGNRERGMVILTSLTRLLYRLEGILKGGK